MAFTKVVGPGIHTLSNIASHNINSSGIITATKFVGPFDGITIGGGTTISSDGINVTGIVTATGLDVNGNGDISGNLVVGGNFTANGDFTTLNTTLREVELLRVDATDNTATAGIITQRGTGDILNLFDTSTEVLTVIDGGRVGVGTISPTHVVHSYGEGVRGGVRLENSHSTTTVSGNTAATAFPHNLILSNYSGLNSANDRIASIGFDIPTTGTYANATIAYQATGAGTGDLQFHLESGNAISERVRFTSSGKILTGNPVTLSHAESASLIVVSANASSGANMLSDSSAIYNHNNPSFLAVQNRYDTGTDQESGIILSQKHSQQGSWAIYGKRTGSYVSDLIFRNRTGSTASAERLRIDSDGRLLIGRSSAYAHADADNLIVGNEATNEHQGITILSHTGKYGGIYFGDGDGATGSNRGKIIYDHPNDQLRIGTGGAAATQFYITSTGKVGVNEGSPLAKLHVKEGDSGVTSADTSQDTLFLESDGNAGLTIATPNANTGYLTFADPEDSNIGQIIYRHGGTYANSMAFFVNTEERLAITSGGQVRIGNYNNLALWGQNNRLQVAGNDWSSSGISIACMGSSGNANLVFGQSRGSTPGTSINAGDRLGYISFVGDDGTDMYTVGAAIVVDTSNQDTVSSNNIPGRIRFYTGGNTADHERLSINSSGKAIFYEEIETPQDYPVHKPSLDFNFARVKKLDSRIIFSRPGPASYVDENGYVKIVGANVPRFDHDPVTRESKGLLAEQSVGNWIKYGTNLTETGWGTNNVSHSIAATEVAPDGNTGSVSEQKENNSSSYHASYIDMSIPMTSGQYYTISTWLKKGPNYRTDINSGNYQLYCSRGTGSVAYVSINSDFDGFVSHSNTIARSLTKYRNGWIRVTYSFQSNQNSSNTMPHWLLGNGGSYAGNGASSVYVWGCQFESMKFPTSYIPTYGSVVYRGTDDARLEGTELTDVFNPIEGTSVVYAHMPNENGGAGLPAYAFKNSAVSSVNLGLSRDSNSNPAYHYYHDGSNTGYSRASSTTNNLYKGALSFKTSDLDSYVNGSLNSNTTTFTMPTIDTLRIGGTSGANYLGGHVARFMYYPVKLTNNQLVTLTS